MHDQAAIDAGRSGDATDRGAFVAGFGEHPLGRSKDARFRGPPLLCWPSPKRARRKS
jgi:hypothetical protein